MLRNSTRGFRARLADTAALGSMMAPARSVCVRGIKYIWAAVREGSGLANRVSGG